MIVSSERFGSFLFVLSFFLKSYLHKTSHSGVWFVVLFSFQRSSAAWRLVYLTKSFPALSTLFSAGGVFFTKQTESIQILYALLTCSAYSSRSTIFAGFIILLGSNAAFIALIICCSPFGVWRLNSFNFLNPMPCSPDILPPRA